MDASARASRSGAPTAQHASAKYEYGSSYQGGAAGPAATRRHVPKETAKSTKQRARSSARPVGRPRCRSAPLRTPSARM
eukprot:scaffold26294_cov30-Tisochrysis_lutea.AAC.5